jgi:hypothetical protein
VHFVHRQRQERAASAISFVHAILRYGAALLVGLLLMSILPGYFDAGLRAARRWPAALGVGALTLIVTIFLALASIAFVLLGVPAGLALVVLYIPMAYLAQIFVGTWLGDAIVKPSTPGTGAQFGRLALGLVIIDAIKLVPILGALVGLAVLLWGTGAILLAIYEHSRRPAVAV